MSAFDGLTLSDYAVASGFSYSPSSTDFGASLSTIFFTMRDKLKGHANSMLSEGLHVSSRGGMGFPSKYSPVHTAIIQSLNSDADLIDKVLAMNQAYSLSVNTLRNSELKHAKLDAEVTLQSAILPHSVAVKDRELDTSTNSSVDQFVWEAAESLLERTSDVSLQQDEQSFRSSESVLDRAQKLALSSDANAWELSETELDNVNNEAMLLAQLRLDFLKALLGQIANSDMDSRGEDDYQWGSSGHSIARANPVKTIYLYVNHFPVLWNADTSLSEPDWTQWREVTNSTYDGQLYDKAYTRTPIGVSSDGKMRVLYTDTLDRYLTTEIWTTSDDI